MSGSPLSSKFLTVALQQIKWGGGGAHRDTFNIHSIYIYMSVFALTLFSLYITVPSDIIPAGLAAVWRAVCHVWESSSRLSWSRSAGMSVSGICSSPEMEERT